MAARRRIAFATRELYPFAPGGIAPITSALARELAAIAEVDVFTTARHREEHARIEPPTWGADVTVHFVAEADERGDHYTDDHAWSARLYEALARHYADGGPDLIEFVDFGGEGFVTIQARHTGEPWLRSTTVAVRLQTSAELASVLNGSLGSDFETEAILEAERYCLQRADALLVPGGDVLDTYRRYYGAARLAPALEVPDAFLTDFAAGDEAGEVEGPLRVLYLGRLERRKGVLNLIRAALRIEADDWLLTLLGGDTDTAPLRGSMRRQLELMTAGDERIAFVDAVPRREVGALIREHDVVVVPSLWECWPNVVREAYLFGRPVLATPVGGLVEMVEPGVSGWLVADASPRALQQELEALIEDPVLARALAAAGGPRAALDRLADPTRMRAAYEAALAAPPRSAAAPRRQQVSVVIPYYRLHEHVEETVRSVLGQTLPPAQVILVNDGSFEGQDAVVERLADRYDLTLVTQPNSGLSAARNFGLAFARGDYVVPVDADNVLEPEFLERCLHALAVNEDLASVTSWATAIDSRGDALGPHRGLFPYGSWSRLIERNNVGGDGTALFRRAVFDDGFAYRTDLTSFEDWFLYRELHRAGRHGAVIPRCLFRYRVREGSMLRTVGLRNTGVLFDEMKAMIREGEMRWTATRA